MKTIILTLALALFGMNHLSAQDFKYTPQNPAFGGNPLNYNGLLGIAQAQNGFKDESLEDRSGFQRDPVEDFRNSLMRQVLSQISRNIIGDPFSEEFQEGVFQFGDFQIEMTPSADGLSVLILDIATGGQTQITIPYF